MKIRETIDDLLNEKEGEFCQFKEWKTKGDFKEAAKICCALANNNGGKLVIGVSDKRPRKIVGSTAFPQPERTRADLMDKIRVRIDFDIHQYENKRVLIFYVGSSPVGLPVQVDGIAWWYRGDSLIPMPEKIRRNIYAESGYDFSGEICVDAEINDLDTHAIEVFRAMWIENSGNKRISSLSVKQLLNDCGALFNDEVTCAALILFGKSKAVARYLPQAEVIFEYRSSEAAGPAAQREEFCEGFFVRSYNRIWELVNLRNDKQHYQDRFAVLPVPTFNERVVREALLNAVSHRDYQLGGSIFVRQYHNRLVIESPGGFPSGITVANILNRQSARNNLIAKIFQLCGFVERSGQGMNLIYELAVKEAKPLPDFKGSDDYFVKLTLNGKVIDSRMLALIKKIGDERLEAMTTEDYILLSALFHVKTITDIQPSRFEHLAELGIVKQTKRGIELVEADLTLVIDESPIDAQSTANRLSIEQGAIEERLENDWGAIRISDRKKQIIDFFAINKKLTSSQLAKYTGLTQGRIRKILKELVADGVIEKTGDYRYAIYTTKTNDE